MSIPIPASTVVLVRDGRTGLEVFMVRRHEASAFMAGAWVFPGGRVDAADVTDEAAAWADGADAEPRFPDLDGAAMARHRVAAARELFEEAGILLARGAGGDPLSTARPELRDRLAADRIAVQRGERTLRAILIREAARAALDWLVPLAHWVTPPVEPRRFDARFFLAAAPAGQQPLHDARETTHGAWIGPATALARCRRGEIMLPPPTWRTLRDLRACASVADAMALARTREIRRIEPRFVEQRGVAMLLLPGDPLWPVPPSEALEGETRFVREAGRWRAL